MDLNEVTKPKILSLPEAASFMKISYVTMYRLVKGGKIKALNIAKTGYKPIFGITPEAIQAYYDSISHSPTVLSEEKQDRGNPERKGIN
jgi:hypothetical protein